MGFMKKVCGKLGLTDESENDELLEEELEEEETSQAASGTKDEQQKKPLPSSSPLPSNVVDLQAAVNGGLRSKMKVVVIEPKSFDDVQQVANYLKEKKPVLINFERTDAEEAHRIIDFISGRGYQEGRAQRVSLRAEQRQRVVHPGARFAVDGYFVAEKVGGAKCRVR